jgi:hypothetical protein
MSILSGVRTHLFQAIERLLHPFSHKPRGTPISDEFRFAKVKWRLDRLAKEAWQSQESLDIPLTLDPLALPTGPPDRIIETILNHARLAAPGLSVPLRVPRVEIGSLIDAAGQFKTSDGWVVVNLASHLLADRRAVGAILAHEACHYILENSGIREPNVDENEKLTDACMFVCGLGLLFLDGYKREDAHKEYRNGHRLGYLTDSEYNFAARYVRELRSTILCDSLRVVNNWNGNLSVASRINTLASG